MTARPVTAVVVGAGHRAVEYASYALGHPEEFRIVGVADPVELRRRKIAELHGLSSAQCFSSAEELARRSKIADAVINGTMDHQHVPTSLPLLASGYDMLLEKPMATSADEMFRLVDAARSLNRRIMVCHVLRYAPFYQAVRKRVASGEIGEILNLQTTEHVSYHHMAVGFVRGKWRNRRLCRSSMLMAKCCHDMDIIAWMRSGIAASRVASVGCRMFFRPEKAPRNAGTRCLVDCPIEEGCLYSARKHYIWHPDRWSFYVWDTLEHIENPTIEQKLESLRTDNPYGRCVWRCDNDVVDHQSVVVEFEDGSTATHNMVGGVSRPMRSIHILGTLGEIQGILEESRFVVRRIDPRPGCEYSEEIVDLSVSGDMQGAFGGHAGGDERLVADFVSFVRGEPSSLARTSIEDSVQGHLIGFCADEAMERRCVVDVPPWPRA
ncbi:MAG: Gfo/Idh/MocA family oxidoreductase [Planctomycetota bacterium]